MDRPDLAEFEALTTTQEAPVEAPQEAPKGEEVEYYLGGKASKLPINAEFSINEDGKVVRAPLSTIVNHYRQRSNLDRQIAEFKKNQESFQAQQKEWGDLEPYRTLQKWSVEKPDEYKTIWELYQNRDKHLLQSKLAQSPETAPLIEEITNLKKTIQDLNQFKSTFEEQQHQKQVQADVAELETEIGAFQKDFPEINLDEKDENGITLKYKIMEFGVDRKIPDFESAALKYLKPRLLDIAGQRSRQEVVKTVQKDAKAGILARSSTPFTQNGQGTKVSPNLSWAERDKLAKAELDAMLRG